MKNITATDFVRRACNTAEHFGFRQTPVWHKHPDCMNCNTSVSHAASAMDRRVDGLYGLLANGINLYANENLHSINGPVLQYSIDTVPRTGEAVLTLQVFGVEKSIGEAMLMQAIRSFLFETGHEDHMVRVNSLGDKDSQTRYNRELTNYLRKRLNDMPVQARELMKESSMAALTYMMEREQDLALQSPSPLEYLTDHSRRHFRDIVEYLEMSESPYEIDPRLLGSHDCYNDALFSFTINGSNGEPLKEQPFRIQGGRYNNFFQKHLGQSVPAVGAVIVLNEKQARFKVPKPKKVLPKVHLIHLGFGPKVRALLLLDQLRSSNITTQQYLHSDSLSEQLRVAEDKGAHYALIIGQKEFVDNTVLVRDMLGKDQETIPMDQVIPRLKKAVA